MMSGHAIRLGLLALSTALVLVACANELRPEAIPMLSQQSCVEQRPADALLLDVRSSG
ncbi:MAG: hypothetical protein AAGC67_00495 [Myxococcota bacterium]